MHTWHQIRGLGLALVVIVATGCGVGLATGAAVVYYKTKGDDQTATVELKAQPDAVYRAAIASAEENPTLTIVKRDEAERQLEISKDQKTVTFKITELSPGVSKLTVSSKKAEAGESSGTDLALEGVKRVCDELKVEYKVVEE